MVAGEGKSDGSRKRVGIVAFTDSPTKKTFRSWAWLGASESEEQLAAARASKSLDRAVLVDNTYTSLCCKLENNVGQDPSFNLTYLHKPAK